MFLRRASVIHRHLRPLGGAQGDAGCTTQVAFASTTKSVESHPRDRDKRIHDRESFPYFLPIQTRWMDNDTYGHVNNVVYYSYFDTVVNEFLIRNKVLDPQSSHVIGLVVETKCQYFKPLSFPEIVDAGLRVAKIGNSSVKYEIGLFRKDDSEAAAFGHFVHVYVDEKSRKPSKVPIEMEKVLRTITSS